MIGEFSAIIESGTMQSTILCSLVLGQAISWRTDWLDSNLCSWSVLQEEVCEVCQCSPLRVKVSDEVIPSL